MRKVSFSEMYNERKRLLKERTPAQIFIDEVATLTKRSPVTIRMWLSGKQVPDLCTQTVIAQHFNVEPSGLFPQCDKL